MVDVEIESLAPNGDGVARVGTRTVAVPFTIPGERVRIALAADRRSEPGATLTAVLQASPHRVTPRCPHFGVDAEPRRSAREGGPCGGCTWQHIAYPEQLRLKTALVERLVRAAVPQAPRSHPMLPSTPIDEPWGYRHKVHFVFGTDVTLGSGRKAHRLVMGHYVRGTRRVIPVRECAVHDPRGNTLAFAFRDAFARAGVQPSDGDGDVQGLAIRVGSGTPEIMATLVVTDDTDKRVRVATRAAFAEASSAKQASKPTSLHVNLHPKRDALIFGRHTRRITGPERMREVVGDISFLVSPTAFFQTNVCAAEILVRLVLDACRFRLEPEARTALDLYAGAGLFSLPLARAGYTVVAVEENRLAVTDGEASLRLNRIPLDRCRFVAQPVEQWRPAKGRPASDTRPLFDVVILDPPREGCTPAVIDRVFGSLRPLRAVYISCNPEALASDLKRIVAHGYTIGALQPVDMFPHTAHIETVVTLTRQSDASSRLRAQP